MTARLLRHRAVEAALERGDARELVHLLQAAAAGDGGVIVRLDVRQTRIGGGAVGAVGNEEMHEVRQVHLPLDHQHPGIHAERAVAHEGPDALLRQRRGDAGSKHGREAHRGVEIERALRVPCRRPPGLAGVAGGRNHQLIGAAAGEEAEAVEVFHRRRSRVNSTASASARNSRCRETVCRIRRPITGAAKNT